MQRRGKSSLDVQMQIRQEHLTEYNYLMNKIGKLNVRGLSPRDSRFESGKTWLTVTQSKLRAKWCPECKRQACASCKTLQVQLESLKVQLEVAQAERHPDLEGIRKENEEKWQRLFTDYSTQLKDNNSKYNTKILELNQEINWSNMKYRKLLREYELCNEQQQHAATVWSRALTYHTNPNALASYQAPVTSYNVAVVDNQQVNSNAVREQPPVTYTDVPNVPKEPIFSPAAEFALSKMKGVPPSRVKELTVPQPPGGWLLIAQSAPPAPMGTQANPAPLPIQPTQTVIQAQGNPPQQTMAPTPVSNPVRLRWDNFRKAHTACEEWFDPSGKDKSGNSKSGKDNHLQKVRGWIEANKITSKADYDQILQDCQAVKAFINSLDGKDKQQKAMLGNTSLFKFAKRTLGTFYAGKATGANGQDPPNQSLVERPHELRQWRSDMAAYARKHQIDDCMDPGSAW